MKPTPSRFRFATLIVAMVLSSTGVHAQRQMENLGRGVVAVRTNSTRVYIGWRLLGTDPDDIGFNLYRVPNGGAAAKLNSSPITNSCNWVDTGATLTQSNAWFVRPVTNGVEGAASAAFGLPANAPTQQYLSIPLEIPAAGTNILGEVYTYNANDCSVGDLDGDGEYEIILKWDPSNAVDNESGGFTGPVYIDAYKLNGTRLWRMNLGPNIRAGAHYTQFIVYDLDGDGKAEMACKTAPGTVDGQTNYVLMPGDDPNIVYTNSSGYILEGPEYLTVFNGLTGAAMFTTNYVPNRGLNGEYVSDWGDSYGNRVDRFLACVAYLDGQRPSLVMCRGYYGPRPGYAAKNFLVAWNWRNGTLSHVWTFEAALGIDDNINVNYVGQGNHNLSVGDVDADGRDEIVYGACAIDDDGTGLYSTGLGHGDAMHLSDLDPSRPGLERWGIHEGTGTPGSALFAAATGQILWQTANADVGRGVAADLTAAFPGAEVWGGTSGLRSIDNQSAGSSPSSSNFAVWWDADLLRELEDGTSVTKYGGGTLLSAAGCASNNGTKSTPCLAADILGDWREEVIWRTSDNQYLRIYTTIIPATNRFYTLMHDPQYRMAIAWQNVAYNQPPHPGFYLGAGMAQPPRALMSDADLAWRGGSGGNAWDVATTSNWLVNGVWTNDVATTFAQGNTVLFDLRGSDNTSVNLAAALAPSKVTVAGPSDYTFAGSGSLTGSLTLYKSGTGQLVLNNTNTYSGATLVSGGTLLVNGTLPNSSVMVENRGTALGGPGRVGGSGALGQGLTIQQGGGLVAGPGTGVAGLLTISNGLIELGNVLNHLDLSNDPSGASNDRVSIIGNLSFSGTNTIAVNQPDGFLGGGVYTLFSYTGTLVGGLTNLVLEGDFLQPVALTNPPGAIALVAIYPSAPPAAPSGLAAAIVGADQIQLTWTDNSANENSFVIERSTNNITFVEIASVEIDVTEYLDAGLAGNTIYYYRVRAHNLAGDSGYSNTASVAPPVAPGNLTATTVGPFQINLAWADNSTDESAFLVERSINNVIFTEIASLGPDVTSCPDNGLTTNTTYYYRVRAQNLAGVSDYSNVASNTTLATVPVLTWRGDGTANDWDVATTANWFDGSNLVTYSDGLDVTFDDTGSNSPVINLAASLEPGSVTVAAAKDYTFSGAGGLGGDMALVKSGAGILTLNTPNTYTGGTTIGDGILFPASAALNSAALGFGAVTFEGGILEFAGFTGSTTPDYGGNTNALIVPAGQTGTIRVPQRFLSPGLAGPLFGAGTLNLVVNYVRGDISGNWSSFSGTINVLYSGSGVDDFRVNNTHGFPNARLNIGNSILMYSRTSAGAVIPIGEFSASANSTISAGGGTSAGTQSAVTWRVGGINTDATNAALIQGTTSLIKEGSGQWTLTGNNTYSGTTVVNEGTLLINGDQSSATGTTTVNDGGTLGGTGTIGSPVTVNSGGALAPGASVGTLSIANNLTLTSAAQLNFELGTIPPSGTSDRVTVSGNLALDGTLNVTDAGGFGIGTYTLLTYGGTLSGALPGIGAKPAGYSCVVNTNTPGEVRLAVEVAVSPVFETVTLTNGVLTFTGTGGSAGGDYYVLTSTNLALPLNQWQPITTNQFNGSGGFNFTDDVVLNEPQRFYLLQVP